MIAWLRIWALIAIGVLLANSQCFARCLTLARQDHKQQCTACHKSPESNTTKGSGCSQSNVNNNNLEGRPGLEQVARATAFGGFIGSLLQRRC